MAAALHAWRKSLQYRKLGTAARRFGWFPGSNTGVWMVQCFDPHGPLISGMCKRSKYVQRQVHEGEKDVFGFPVAVNEVDESSYDPKVVELLNRVMDLSTVEIIQMLQLMDFKSGGLLTKDIFSWNLGLGGAAGPSAAQATPGSGGGPAASAAAAAPEKKFYELKLVGYEEGAKIKVIKEVRAICGLGLAEAKALVDGVPNSVKKDIKKEEADQLSEKLKAAGAIVELV